VQLQPDEDGTPVEEAVSAYVQAMARLRVDQVEVVAPGVIDPGQRAIRDERKWD
jgi:hypothetical protein